MSVNYGKIKETECPVCKYKLNDATTAVGENTTPREGDISVCIGCAEVLIFTKDLSVRLATISDLLDIGQENFNTITATQHVIRFMRRSK